MRSAATTAYSRARHGARMSGARGARLLAALAAMGLAVLALAAAPALAEHLAHPKLGEITGPKPGQFFGQLASESVAVDDADGHVLVADSSDGTVYDYSSLSDTSPEAWTGSNTPADSFGGSWVSVAVDDSTGDVYVAGNVAHTEEWVVDKFEASGRLIASFGDTAPEPNGQLAGLDTPAKSFAHPVFATPLGIAVDQATHDLYVLDPGHKVIDVFNEDGTYLSQITEVPAGALYQAGGADTSGIAVAAFSGDVFVSEPHCEKFTSEGYCEIEEGDEVFEFGPLGSVIATFTGAGALHRLGGAISVAVNDRSEDFYVSNNYPAGNERVDEFGPGGIGSEGYLGEITGVLDGGGGGGGLAVDQASGDVYVSEDRAYSPVGGVVRVFGGEAVPLPTVTTEPAVEATATSVKLKGEVDPEGLAVSECVFEYVAGAEYEHERFAFDPYSEGGTVPCEPAAGAIPVDESEHQVHAVVSGLHVGSEYHFRLRAGNVHGSEYGNDESVETLPAPSIDSAFSRNETSSSAELVAEINPKGAATTYRFEYGPSTEYGEETPKAGSPEAEIGAGTSDVLVHQEITGLKPNVTYHWRVAASSSTATATSADHTFLYDTSGEGLPDGRAYEMVTPPAKNGALLNDILLRGQTPVLAEDGSRVILQSIQCFGGAESCPGDHGGEEGSSYEFTRTPTGWVTTPLAPPASLGISAVRKVDADEGTALFTIPTAPDGEEDFYAREEGGSFLDVGPVSPPERGVLGAPFVEDVTEATADLSTVVLMATGFDQGSEHRLFRWPFDETTGESSVYAYSSAGGAGPEHHEEPKLVGVSGGPGSTSLISRCGTALGAEDDTQGFDTESALSEDGSIVFFTALGGAGCYGWAENAGTQAPVDELYARVGGSETVAVSEPSSGYCASSPPPVPACAPAEFQGASSDGSRVFFTSAQKLTGEATQGSENLYEAELQRNAHTGHTEVAGLVDVSQAQSGGEAPAVQGVMAISADGSHVYFVAQGVLSSDERPGCAAQFEAAGVAEEGRCRAKRGRENLYEFAEGRTTFVATLSANENQIPGDPEQWNHGAVVANVTPDGGFLVFTSREPLTADDTGGSGAQQVFRFDAGTGALVRVSIGQRGFDDDGNAASAAAGASIVVSGAASSSQAGPRRGDPTMSSDGARVFFSSPVALTPHALGEDQIATLEGGRPVYAENVYEWEQEGVGSCPAGQAPGCVFLISDGKDTGETSGSSDVRLIGTDQTGANVFFSTSDQLVPADIDTQVDYYDARVCGAEGCIQPAAVPAPPCLGEQCHGTPAATPLLPSVPSATFDGAGNLSPSDTPVPVAVKPKPATRAQKLAAALKQCRKDRSTRKRAACEKQARKQYVVNTNAKGKKKHAGGKKHG